MCRTDAQLAEYVEYKCRGIVKAAEWTGVECALRELHHEIERSGRFEHE
jgi:hypothetical protein